MAWAARRRPYRLYRWRDGEGVLLYVGITIDPKQREAVHRTSSWWAKWATQVTVEAEPCGANQAVAEAVEMDVIEREQPIFNREGVEAPESRRKITEYLIGRGVNPEPYGEHFGVAPWPLTVERSPSGSLMFRPRRGSGTRCVQQPRSPAEMERLIESLRGWVPSVSHDELKAWLQDQLSDGVA
jgi:hypothetical protein